jgi:hypothetical protein
MADEKKSGSKPEEKPYSDPFVEIVWLILSLFVLMYIVNGLITTINSGNLSLFGLKILGPQKSISLSQAPTLLDGKVVATRNTPVFAEPGVNQITTEPVGSRATIVEGPIIKDGIKYWHVIFDDGTDGWVSESNLNYLTLTKQPLSQVQNPESGRVAVSINPTAIFAEPGTNQVGTEAVNSEGSIEDGPVTQNGIRYWKIRFDDGAEGWVAETNLDYVISTSVPLSSMPTMIGANVLTLRDGTILYNNPGGGQIGTVKKGTTGQIIEGPLIKNGVKYWHIKLDDGREGWITENDLEYVVDQGLASQAGDYFIAVFSIFKYVAIILSILLIGFIIYLYKKIVGLRVEEVKKLYVERSNPVSVNNPQWERVLSHIESTIESDWRLAILEADMILDTLLDNMNLPGETMADKLKAVEQSDFNTIDNAWEAHKIRNQIAHEGDFMLSQVEAKRVIGLFQTVFEEFRII